MCRVLKLELKESLPSLLELLSEAKSGIWQGASPCPVFVKNKTNRNRRTLSTGVGKRKNNSAEVVKTI